MSLILYYYRYCPSCKTVLNVLNLLGVKATLTHLDLKKKEQLQDWFLKLNPQHTVPVLVDGDLTITESRPIMTYLVAQYGGESQLYPAGDARTRARIDNWLYFDHGTLTPSQRKIYGPFVFRQAYPDDEAILEYEEKLARIEAYLADRDYFVSQQLTLADIAIYITLYQSELVDYDFSKFKNVTRWREAIRAQLPAEKEINAIPLAEQKESIRALIAETKAAAN